MPEPTAPPRAPEETGDRGFRLIYKSALFCKQGDNPHNISFVGQTRSWLSFTFYKCFEWQNIYPPHILGCSWRWSCRFLRILEENKFSDSLHITQFSSKWQLAHFLQTGSTCNAILQSVICSATVRTAWIHFHFTTILYTTSKAQWAPREFPFEKLGKE